MYLVLPFYAGGDLLTRLITCTKMTMKESKFYLASVHRDRMRTHTLDQYENLTRASVSNTTGTSRTESYPSNGNHVQRFEIRKHHAVQERKREID